MSMSCLHLVLVLSPVGGRRARPRRRRWRRGYTRERRVVVAGDVWGGTFKVTLIESRNLGAQIHVT